MDEQNLLAERFEANRAHLRAVAYRMLGSLSEADDAVQEAWLRLEPRRRQRRREPGRLADHGRRRGSASTCCARASRGARSRSTRTCPSRSSAATAGRRSRARALLADSVGLALLVVLETLAPAERLAFVLHDMFAVPFDEIAPIVGRSPAAARQLASRARRRVQGADRLPTPTSPVSGRSSTPSSPPRAAATSRRCSRCSIPTSCSGPTTPPCAGGPRELRGAEAVAKRLPGRAGGRPPWSTARSASSWRRAGGCCWCSASRSTTARSSRSTLIADPERLGEFDLSAPRPANGER